MGEKIIRRFTSLCLALGIAAAGVFSPAGAAPANPSSPGTASAGEASAAWTPDFPVTSGAVYLVSAETGVVLYEKNAEKRMYPASLTKLMTVSLVVSHFKNLDEPITITKEDVDSIKGTGGTTGGFVADERTTVRHLLFSVLLESANEGAVTLARVTAGSSEKFVRQMNEKAKELGCTDTHFVNPHGLHNPDHYSSAHDLYRIARYAMSFPILQEIVATEKYLMPQTNKHKAHYIRNTNLLLNDASGYYYAYCKGIKTGTTTPAGRCLASYARNPDRETYYCVVLDSPPNAKGTNGALLETRELYRWAYGKFRIAPLLDKQEIEAQMPLKLAWNQTTLSLYPASQLNTLVPRKSDLSHVDVKIRLSSKTAFAPIRSGEPFGAADIYLGGKKMGNVRLVAHDNIARSMPLAFVYALSVFFHSGWFIVLIVALAALFVLFLVLGSRLKPRSHDRRGGNFLASSRPLRTRRHRRQRRRF